MASDGSEYVGQQILGSGMVIAIDGPSGVGKSTVARMAAAELGTNFLDTGAMYRAVAWWALQKGTNLNDPEALGTLAAKIPLTVEDVAHAPRILVDGQDVSRHIRSSQVTQIVSKISAVPQVRQEMIGLQRYLINQARQSGRGIVVEGRDITTVVAPDADLRILLTADEAVRQQRRGSQPGADQSDQVALRDAQDSLVNNFTTPAEGVQVIDSTNLDVKETIEKVVQLTGQAFQARKA